MRGAPKGNKFAVGNNGGAPRTVSLPKDDMIKLGEEMVKWVEENKPLHLSFWYKGIKKYRYSHWKSLIQIKEFLPYYDRAISLVSENYLNGKIPPPMATRFLRVYFDDLREEENDKMKIEADLKKQEESKPPTEIVFKVNYDNSRDTIQISPSTLSSQNPEGSQ